MLANHFESYFPGVAASQIVELNDPKPSHAPKSPNTASESPRPVHRVSVQQESLGICILRSSSWPGSDPRGTRLPEPTSHPGLNLALSWGACDLQGPEGATRIFSLCFGLPCRMAGESHKACSMLPAPAASTASSGSLLEMQTVRPQPRATDVESAFGRGPWEVLVKQKQYHS